MSEIIEGIVQALNVKEDRYGLRLSDNNWYNDFGKAIYEDNSEIQKGDKVKIEYNIKGTFKNIVKIEKIGESMEKEASQKTAKEYFKPANEYYKERDNSIIRQVAFKGAIEVMNTLMNNKGVAFTKEGVIDAVKQYTDEFEKVIIGYETKDSSKGNDKKD